MFNDSEFKTNLNAKSKFNKSLNLNYINLQNQEQKKEYNNKINFDKKYNVH